MVASFGEFELFKNGEFRHPDILQYLLDNCWNSQKSAECGPPTAPYLLQENRKNIHYIYIYKDYGNVRQTYYVGDPRDLIV